MLPFSNCLIILNFLHDTSHYLKLYYAFIYVLIPYIPLWNGKVIEKKNGLFDHYSYHLKKLLVHRRCIINIFQINSRGDSQ